MTGPLAYLSRLCRRWGGDLVLVPEPEFRMLYIHSRWVDDGITPGPDGYHATDRPNRRVIAVEHRHNVGAIVHEMGHAFLREAKPSNFDEFRWLGWEITLARRARCYRTWDKQNADYVINTNRGELEWRQLTVVQRRRLIADRIAYAKKIGIVSRRGVPLCTRKS